MIKKIKIKSKKPKKLKLFTNNFYSMNPYMYDYIRHLFSPYTYNKKKIHNFLAMTYLFHSDFKIAHT